MHDAIVNGIALKLRLSEPSKLLIGYIDDRGVEYLASPSLETDTHADDRGGYAPKIIHAAKCRGMKAINIHAFSYGAGEVEISFPTGAFTVAGVIPDSVQLAPRDAGLDTESLLSLDWLYEER